MTSEGMVGAQRLSNRRAVVVGAGQSPGATMGIGRATALTFARAGAKVLLVDSDPDTVQETAEMIGAEGGTALVHIADITLESDCRSIAMAAVDMLGGVDIVQNTIGILGPGDAVDLSEELWDRVFDVNLKGMWLTCKHVLPVMRAQRSGAIVNISSIAAIGARSTAYGASKAGVNSLTRSLALANAPFGIRVNAVMPGLIDTPMGVEGAARQQGAPRDEVAAKRAAQCPMGFQGTAWDIAHSSLFLVSDDARYVSGVCLPVDGAWSLG